MNTTRKSDGPEGQSRSTRVSLEDAIKKRKPRRAGSVGRHFTRKARTTPRATADVLAKALGSRVRGPIAYGAGRIERIALAGQSGKPSVETDIIRNVSIATNGEALGHGLWLDDTFLTQVTDAINSTPGIKARFTHPSLSGDGLGTMLGVIRNARVSGGRVTGDLHLSKHAYDTPDGNLADYVKRLAAEDPEHFGVSIVFDFNREAEQDFTALHSDQSGQFQSPDSANLNHFPHARLAKLRAADVVDDPAANPDGLFYVGQDIATEAEQILLYALGETSTAPDCAVLSLDAVRVAAFVQRTLKRHGLIVRGGAMERKTEDADDEVSASETTRQLVRERAGERIARLRTKDNRPKLEDVIVFR